MLTGVVKWFDCRKGYGFIIPIGTDNKVDIFVHYSVIQNRQPERILCEGQFVHYELEAGRDEASRVRPYSCDEVLASLRRRHITALCNEPLPYSRDEILASLQGNE